MSKDYKRTIEWSDKDQAWVVRFPDLAGCSTHGSTLEEAAANADEALKVFIETAKAAGISLPSPAPDKLD